MKKINITLLIIIIVSTLLRIWNLGIVPVSPDWDEVALGYNAYSIMQTGRDEYGKFLPVILRSFDDYKPALYAYLTIPFIKLFGLNVLSVRLPSAIFGILTVLATYFLTKKLFKNYQLKIRVANLELGIAEIAALLLAISPWHLQFSRVAFEANVGLAFNVFSILFFLKGLKKQQFLFLSLALMSFSLYIYQSEKVLVPLLLSILLIIFRKELLTIKKSFIKALLLAFLISLPFLIFTFTNKDAFARAKGVSIFTDTSTFSTNDYQKLLRDQIANDKLGLIFDSHKVLYLKKIVSNYLSHYDLNWLFIKGDFENNRHHAPNMGLLYLFELPLLLIGLYMFLFSEIDRKYKILVILIVLITPIPASITKDVPHAVRTIHFLPFFQIFTALGILIFIHYLLNIKHRIKYFLLSISFLFVGFNFLYYLDQYFIQQNYFYAKDWQYGYKELVDYLKPEYKKYKKIIVSNRTPLDQSYMFFLFYLKYDPQKYLNEGGTKSGGIGQEGNKFENFEFRQFNYYEEKEKKILMIGSKSDFPEIFKTIKTINYPDKSLAIRVVEKD